MKKNVRYNFFRLLMLCLIIGFGLFSIIATGGGGGGEDDENIDLDIDDSFFIQKFIDTYEGTFSGDDSGIFELDVDKDWSVTGSAYSEQYKETIHFIGKINESGDFTLTGNALGISSNSPSFTFNGRIYNNFI